MSWIEDKAFLEVLAKSYDKRIKLYAKDNTVSYIIAWILFIISFGTLTKEKYLKGTATCLANFHFFPKEWSTSSVLRVLPHEARHTKQLTWCGAGIHPLLGLPIAAIIYLFLLLPVMAGLGRFFMELDADMAAWRELKMEPNAALLIRTKAPRRAASLASSTYLYAVPLCFSKWMYNLAAEKVINEPI